MRGEERKSTYGVKEGDAVGFAADGKFLDLAVERR